MVERKTRKKKTVADLKRDKELIDAKIELIKAKKRLEKEKRR